jgi:hypothetical protein
MSQYTLNAVKWTVLNKKLPSNDASLPVCVTRSDNTISGSADIYIEGLTGVNTLDTSIYKVLAPTGAITQWSKVEPRLDSVANTYVGFTGITSDHQRIDFRFDFSGITGSQSGNYYGVEFSINEDAGITGITYTPAIVFKMYDPIDFTGLTGVSGDSFFGITGPKGDKGDTGLQGPTGYQGQTGLQCPGSTGVQGVTGLIGPTGANGVQGTQGQTGIQGQTGLIGTTGATGVQGAQGTTGLIGQTGIDAGVTGAIVVSYNNFGTSLNPTGILCDVTIPYRYKIYEWETLCSDGSTGTGYIQLGNSTYENFPPTNLSILSGYTGAWLDGQNKNRGTSNWTGANGDIVRVSSVGVTGISWLTLTLKTQKI